MQLGFGARREPCERDSAHAEDRAFVDAHRQESGPSGYPRIADGDRRPQPPAFAVPGRDGIREPGRFRPRHTIEALHSDEALDLTLDVGRESLISEPPVLGARAGIDVHRDPLRIPFGIPFDPHVDDGVDMAFLDEMARRASGELLDQKRVENGAVPDDIEVTEHDRRQSMASYHQVGPRSARNLVLKPDRA